MIKEILLFQQHSSSFTLELSKAFLGYHYFYSSDGLIDVIKLILNEKLSWCFPSEGTIKYSNHEM